MRYSVYPLAILLSVCLSACAGLPGSQTLGLVSPSAQEMTLKAVAVTAVAATIFVDSAAAYGALPPCPQPSGICRKQKQWTDVRLLVSAVADGFVPVRRSVASGTVSPLSTAALAAFLVYGQYQVAKTIAQESGPTVPGAPPTPAAVQYLEAAGMADVLVNDMDERIQAVMSESPTRESVLGLLDTLAEHSKASEAP